MLERFVGSSLILIIGFDAIWLGCRSNGADNDRNPVWGLLEGFITLQKYILGFALAIIIGIGIWHLWGEIISFRRRNDSLKLPDTVYLRYENKPEKNRFSKVTESSQVPKPEALRRLESNLKGEAGHQLAPTVLKTKTQSQGT